MDGDSLKEGNNDYHKSQDSGYRQWEEGHCDQDVYTEGRVEVEGGSLMLGKLFLDLVVVT